MAITVQRLAYVPYKMKRTARGSTYTTQYLVCADDNRCFGVETLLKEATSLPQMGDIYNPYKSPVTDPCEYNEHSYVTEIDVDQIDVRKARQEFGTSEDDDLVKCATYAWIVTFEYTPERGCNPALWCPDVNFSSILRDAPLTNVTFDGYYESDIEKCDTGDEPTEFMGIDTPGANCYQLVVEQCYLTPLNVVGERMIDGPTIPESDFEMSINFWRVGLTSADPYDFAGHCNETAVRVYLPCRSVDICFPPRTLLCTSVDLDGDEMIDCAAPTGEPLRFFNLSYGFMYRPKQFIWDLDNAGYHSCRPFVSGGETGGDPLPATIEEIRDQGGGTSSVPRSLTLNGVPREGEDNKRTILRYSKSCKNYYDITFGLYPGILIPPFGAVGCNPEGPT